eukprot:TRINITY_DN3078_c0_g1_i2.p1 TRINITY_DN3078_c0_g1~~TRINITY_DN3078_c0_g1_i2.p1  ORF type:complete len:844 (-),score=195.01 TRINITY_DN3078_c0_g1_i2:135-2666(-)
MAAQTPSPSPSPPSNSQALNQRPKFLPPPSAENLSRSLLVSTTKRSAIKCGESKLKSSSTISVLSSQLDLDSRRPSTTISGGSPSISPRSLQSASSSSCISLSSLNTDDPDLIFVRKALKKLVVDERNYIHGIGSIVKGYLPNMSLDIITKENKDLIFMNIEEIYYHHVQLRPQLDEALKKWPRYTISSIFLVLSQIIQSDYMSYVSNIQEASSLLENLIKQNKSFVTSLKSCENLHSIPPLTSLISLPVERITAYLEFLNKFLDYFKKNPAGLDEKEMGCLNEIYDLMDDFSKSFHTRDTIAKNLNQVMDISNTLQGFEDNLVRPGRRLIREGVLSWIVADNAKPKADYAYLFNDILICSKTKGKKDTGKIFQYVSTIQIYKLNLKEINGNSNDDGFTLKYGNETLRLVAPSLGEKDAWVWDLCQLVREVEKSQKVFGVPLKTLVQREEGGADLPLFIVKSAAFISDYGLECEGIFRQTGRSTQLEDLKDMFNQGQKVFFNPDLNPHAVAELIKLWLRELPEPLITWEIFLNYTKLKPEIDKEALIKEMKHGVENIQKNNKNVLQFLLKLLHTICQRESLNKMSATNLGTVFGPSLLRYDESSVTDPREIASVHRRMQDLVSFLVENYPRIFSGIEEERHQRELQKIAESTTKKPDRRVARLSLPLTSKSDIQLLQDIEKDYLHKISVVSKHSPSSVSHRDESPSSLSGRDSLVDSPKECSFISKEGWLKKKGGTNSFSGGWKPRWMVLKYKSLSYFGSSQDTKPKGVIVLSGCVVGRSVTKEYCFYIKLPEKKTFLFVAKDEKDRSEWLHAIRDCIENTDESPPQGFDDLLFLAPSPLKKK